MKVQYYDVSYDKYTHFKMHDPYTVNVVLKLFEFRYKLDKKCFLSKIHFTVKYVMKNFLQLHVALG